MGNQVIAGETIEVPTTLIYDRSGEHVAGYWEIKNYINNLHNKDWKVEFGPGQDPSRIKVSVPVGAPAGIYSICLWDSYGTCYRGDIQVVSNFIHPEQRNV